MGGYYADRIGPIDGLFIATIFARVGGALQAATQSSDFILIAGVVIGLGTGVPSGVTALTSITLVLVSEISTTAHRCGFLSYVFIANCR